MVALFCSSPSSTTTSSSVTFNYTSNNLTLTQTSSITDNINNNNGKNNNNFDAINCYRYITLSYACVCMAVLVITVYGVYIMTEVYFNVLIDRSLSMDGMSLNTGGRFGYRRVLENMIEEEEKDSLLQVTVSESSDNKDSKTCKDFIKNQNQNRNLKQKLNSNSNQHQQEEKVQEQGQDPLNKRKRENTKETITAAAHERNDYGRIRMKNSFSKIKMNF